jgi:hypothetical protein
MGALDSKHALVCNKNNVYKQSTAQILS